MSGAAQEAAPPLGDGHLPGGAPFSYVSWAAGFANSDTAHTLPFCLRIILENCLRNQGPGWTTASDLDRLFDWRPGAEPFAVPLRVSRAIMPDSSGLPALMDLAALRDLLALAGRDPSEVQPQIPVDLVVDHSVTADFHGTADAVSLNVAREYERNAERYRFFKWAEKAFERFRVVPPGMGIVHQVHIERLARVVEVHQRGDQPPLISPEFVLGGDSHTPMVNGLGVLAWGVGGVEIETALLGEPYVTAVPEVVGVRLSGALPAGVTISDLVLTITERLRATDVVGCFVEFFGPGYGALTIPDRATIANMAPEYGATAAFFPLDDNSFHYLRQTGRDPGHVDLIEAFARQAGFYAGGTEPVFDRVIEVDLETIEASLAGPKRPQDRLPLAAAREAFGAALTRPADAGGYGLTPEQARQRSAITIANQSYEIGHGSLAIAAITACTSTSNPAVMLTAGLVAKKAVERGLVVPPFVKTTLAPGSLVVPDYLKSLGLLEPLEVLGFYIVGYGCTTCSGKSGPLIEPMAQAIEADDLVAAAIVSSNRNFEGRLHRQVRAGYLASPPLVVAFALAGRIDIDLSRDPVGYDRNGAPVFLTELWPSPDTIAVLLEQTRNPDLYRRVYGRLFEGTRQWQNLEAPDGLRFPWDPNSTYILPPPFFERAAHSTPGLPDTIADARVLGFFGDGLTTDHISPAGEIPRDSEAGRYLAGKGVAPTAFNAFTMRRGNHHVMTLGTYANVRTHNRLTPDRVGGTTVKFPEGAVMHVAHAAEHYAREGTPLIVLGGRDYGMGSSRDWAAKGPRLLGVRAVIAVSFERIHRSNLIALGIIPLAFEAGQSADTLGLSGSETVSLMGLVDAVFSGTAAHGTAVAADGHTTTFQVRAMIASNVERRTLAAGGVFARVADRLLGTGHTATPDAVATSHHENAQSSA